jgi:hypothetical protein
MKNMEHENKMVVRVIKDPRIVSKRDTRHEGSKEPQIVNEISINYIMSKVIWNRNINDVDKFVYIQHSTCYYA